MERLFLGNKQGLCIKHQLDIILHIAALVLHYLHLDEVVLEPEGDDDINIILELGQLHREVVGIEDNIVSFK